MPFAEDLVRVQIRGSFLSAAGGPVVETFVFGLHLWRHNESPGDPIDWQANTQIVATGVRDAWESAFALIAGRFSQTVRFDEVRAYHLTPAGTTLHMAQAPFTGVVGTGGSSLPIECAIAVSLYAYAEGEFNPDGGKARGRFYLPALNVGQVGVDGTLPLAGVDPLANAIDGFLEEVQGMNDTSTPLSDDHFDIVIASNVDAGRRQVVRSRIGRVVDVQRRRRRSLPEGYVDRALSNH